MHSVWRIHPPDSKRVETLSKAIGVSPLTAQLLINRGVRDIRAAKRFLNPNLGLLDEPLELPDMERGVERIKQAITRKEPILIFGDSDIDGISASVILYELLCKCGAVVCARQSNRITDGYGLPQSAIKHIIRSSTKLVILVDCGTNQPDAIRKLSSCGIDTIIIDHHVPLDESARPLALINPHCTASQYQRELSSSGIAFKVAQALLLGKSSKELEANLDLATLGTLGDYSQLIGDNRIIASLGLPRITQSHRKGLARLCNVTCTTKPEPEHIAKRLIPRLNASGRLGDVRAVWHLLLESCGKKLEECICATEEAHTEAKRMHQRIFSEAREQVDRIHFRDQYVFLVSGSGWHRGFMGSLASQLSERYGRAAIALAMDESCGVGSGRSVPHLNLLSVLKSCEKLLVQFGGHAQACGLTIERKCIGQFRESVNNLVRQSLGREGLLKRRLVDLELSIDSISPSWAEEISELAPFGKGNERPTVLLRNLTIDVKSIRKSVISDGKHSSYARGSFGAVVRGNRYDVVVNPATSGGELLLMVKDMRSTSSTADLPSGDMAPYEPVPI